MSQATPLQSGKYYHIYSRGNNRENLFVEDRNYRYFLKLYAYHIEPVADTFAEYPRSLELKFRLRAKVRVSALQSVGGADFSFEPELQFRAIGIPTNLSMFISSGRQMSQLKIQHCASLVPATVWAH